MKAVRQKGSHLIGMYKIVKTKFEYRSKKVCYKEIFHYSNLIYSALYPYLANQTNKEVQIVYYLFNCCNLLKIKYLTQTKTTNITVCRFLIRDAARLVSTVISRSYLKVTICVFQSNQRPRTK